MIPIQIPPLRERKEDIPLLVQHFLQQFAEGDRQPAARAHGEDAGRRAAVAALSVSQQALRCLMAYPWPGNVRQLENAVERAVALRGGRTQIEVSDLPPEVQGASEPGIAPTLALPEEGLDFPLYISRIEGELIALALERTGGNKGQAARLLALKRTTLVEKLKRLDKGR